MQEPDERQPDAVRGGANRSTPNVVINFMTKVYKKQAEEERFSVPVKDPVGVSGVVRMIQHVRELGSAIRRQTQQLRLITNTMEIGRCTDKEKYDGSAPSVCAFIDEGVKDEKMRTWMPSCRKLGMMCLVLPWTRRKSDGRGSRRSSTSKTRRFGGGSLDKKLHAEVQDREGPLD